MADRHTLGLDPDVDLRDHPMSSYIDHGRDRVVLVGDVEVSAIRIEIEEFRICARWQISHDCTCRYIQYLDRIVI